MRPGGLLGLNLVQSSEDLARSDRFITSLIPVGEDTVLVGGGATVSARKSRLNLEVRRGSDLGEFRGFVEGDFLGVSANGSETFRLRHAFGQYKNLTIGQTWSTFVNPFTGPEDVDLEGVNADVTVRQALARWESPLAKGRLSVSVEQQKVSVTNAIAKTRFWDTLGRYSRRGDFASFYVAGVARPMVAEPFKVPGRGEATRQEFFGWGVTGGADFSLPRLGSNDGLLLTATLGEGIAQYINDIESAGGLDAYVDPETGRLETPSSASVLLSYRHFWGFEWRDFRSLRSTFTLGLVKVDYPTEVADSFLERTVRTSFNLLWSPLEGIDLGVELLWGRRDNVNGESGTARQVQFATFYRF